MGFLAVELDLSRCSAEVKWLRQVRGKKYRRGLKVALQIALKLKRELRNIHALLKGDGAGNPQHACALFPLPLLAVVLALPL